MENKQNVLLLDEMDAPVIIEDAASQSQAILKEFIKSYAANKDNMALGLWLSMELKNNLPEKPDVEITQISEEILATIETNENKKQSLEAAIKNGRSKESWFANESKSAISNMSTQEASKYLQDLDTALSSTNDALYDTLLKQSGSINMNPHLDGFIAEQYHAQTFNMNAAATGSPYRAKVLQADGKAYTKNSVDIVITDANGTIVKRYQSKYYKDAKSTLEAFKKGDYRGQRKLVPDDQIEHIANASNMIEAPDGTTSNPLSKQSAKELQHEAQSGKWSELDWNDYKVRDIATGIGKQAGQAALLGAAVGTGFYVAQKAWDGEEIVGEEVVEAAIVSGADFGIKAAVAGALKVGVEKGIITAIPKGTPAGTLANIAFVAVENVKIVGKVATGEFTLKEGLDKMEQVTVATVAGIAASVKGMAVGAAIGSVLGPVGSAVGGFVGGTIGYMAGSKVGETVVKGVQKIRKEIVETVKSIGETVREVKSDIKDYIRSRLPIFDW